MLELLPLLFDEGFWPHDDPPTCADCGEVCYDLVAGRCAACRGVAS